MAETVMGGSAPAVATHESQSALNGSFERQAGAAAEAGGHQEPACSCDSPLPPVWCEPPLQADPGIRGSRQGRKASPLTRRARTRETKPAAGGWGLLRTPTP